jgi:hypothetical protein
VADWSTGKPGAIVFDAIHRRTLLRFPDAAERIAEALKGGQVIEKVEVEFEFVGTEYFPMDYRMPSGMSFMGNLWVKKQPRWHAVAHALKQPWAADKRLGPTFNASVNGKRFWSKFGAQNGEADRHAKAFGPTEVSKTTPKNHMDVTALLTDAAYGKDLAARLRAFADRGLIIRKWESYDALYNPGFYEYGGAPGHRGIRIKAPKLIVTLKGGEAELGALAPAVEIRTLPKQGRPTAVVAKESVVEGWIAEHGFRQPEGMPLWQWRRLEELFRGARGKKGGFPESYEAYLTWLDGWLAMPYRLFTGHHTTMTTHDCLLYAQTWPAPVREHMKAYWDAWLMPGRPYTDTAHNQFSIWTKPENSYYEKTGDWRGNHSFYRGSYTRFMSTMNFNHNAAIAALLGGHFTNNPEAIEDGRFALETILLRLWSWYDGTTQESIDHYYLGLSLYGQKSFQDLGKTELERLMGRSMLLKTMDELASCYHPALKRFISSSGRTGVAEMFCINEGVNSLLHTVSRKGALHNLNNPDTLGMPVFGHDLPPDLVARQAIRGPWLPLWMGNVVDSKPLPFQMTAAYKQWGNHLESPMWKRSYQSRYYGLASVDVLGGNEMIPFMAQWRRAPGERAWIQDIATLLARYGVNRTEFYDSIWHGSKRQNANGIVGTQGGFTASLQHRNKAILLMSPYDDLKVNGRAAPKAVHSFQSSIALANYAKAPNWTLRIDGKDADLSALPIRATMSSRITVHDGVSYLGLIPIPATDLGRDEEILITGGGEPVDLQGGGKAAPTLVINSYNYRNAKKAFPQGKALKADAKLSDRVARAFGGFVVELGDVSQYESFDAFENHIRSAHLDVKWDDKTDQAEIRYTSGPDSFEAGFRPHFKGARWGAKGRTDRCFTYRRVNGRWPYLAKGMDRDSTLGQQGRTGRLEKNGAVLVHQPGFMGYLLTEPVSGNVLFANPLPDPQYLVADAPGGIRIKPDGKVGLLHMMVNAGERSIEVNYAVKAGQVGPAMADALYIFGMKSEPRVTRNGSALAGLQLVKVDGQAAWRIPLLASEPHKTVEAIVARYENNAMDMLSGLSALGAKAPVMRYVEGQEHYVLTYPKPGAASFWRCWPMESPVDVLMPTGERAVLDGNLALQRIVVDPWANHILMDYAPYLQRAKADGKPIKDRAKALLVFGFTAPPTATLHGKEYRSDGTTVTIDGKQAYVIPLFGESAKAVAKGAGVRYVEAMARLEGKK